MYFPGDKGWDFHPFLRAVVKDPAWGCPGDGVESGGLEACPPALSVPHQQDGSLCVRDLY